MKLYYIPGACSLATHIVLNELNIPVDLDKADTAAGTTEAGVDFLKINPNGYVPALVNDSGDIITESPAVLQYLADQNPDAGLAPPAGTLERARLHEMLNFISSELHKAFGPFFSGKDLDDDAKQDAADRVCKRVAHIERNLLDDRTYLLGDTFTVVDALAFVVINWSNFVGINLEPFPKTQAYLARIAARPSVVDAMLAEGLIDAAQVA